MLRSTFNTFSTLQGGSVLANQKQHNDEQRTLAAEATAATVAAAACRDRGAHKTATSTTMVPAAATAATAAAACRDRGAHKTNRMRP